MSKLNFLDLLRGSGSIIINKGLAREIGLQETVIYSELVSKYMYWKERGQLKDGVWFFCTFEDLEKETTIKERTARKYVNKLEELGFIESALKGASKDKKKTKHYRIVEEKILSLYGLPSSKEEVAEEKTTEENDMTGKKCRTSDEEKSMTGKICSARPANIAKQDRQKMPTNNTKNLIILNNNTNKRLEREIIKGANIDPELKEFLNKHFETFVLRGIDLDIVIGWLEENEERYTYRQLANGIFCLLEYQEPIKTVYGFLESTFADIEKYIKRNDKKQKRSNNKKTVKQQDTEQGQASGQAIPFFNWLDQ